MVNQLPGTTASKGEKSAPVLWKLPIGFASALTFAAHMLGGGVDESAVAEAALRAALEPQR